MSHSAWLLQAESDLGAAELLSAGGFHSQSVWLSAQAVEKAHKAVLVALGLRYEERHFKRLGHETNEIARLLPEALQEPADTSIAVKLSTLESRGSTSRYPALGQTPATTGTVVAPSQAMTSSAQDVSDAKLLVEWCRERVDRALRGREAMRPQKP